MVAYFGHVSIQGETVSFATQDSYYTVTNLLPETDYEFTLETQLNSDYLCAVGPVKIDFRTGLPIPILTLTNASESSLTFAIESTSTLENSELELEIVETSTVKKFPKGTDTISLDQLDELTLYTVELREISTDSVSDKVSIQASTMSKKSRVYISNLIDESVSILWDIVQYSRGYTVILTNQKEEKLEFNTDKPYIDITGLQPDTDYYGYIKSDLENYQYPSENFSFHTKKRILKPTFTFIRSTGLGITWPVIESQIANFKITCNGESKTVSVKDNSIQFYNLAPENHYNVDFTPVYKDGHFGKVQRISTITPPASPRIFVTNIRSSNFELVWHSVASNLENHYPKYSFTVAPALNHYEKINDRHYKFTDAIPKTNYSITFVAHFLEQGTDRVSLYSTDAITVNIETAENSVDFQVEDVRSSSVEIITESSAASTAYLFDGMELVGEIEVTEIGKFDNLSSSKLYRLELESKIDGKFTDRRVKEFSTAADAPSLEIISLSSTKQKMIFTLSDLTEHLQSIIHVSVTSDNGIVSNQKLVNNTIVIIDNLLPNHQYSVNYFQEYDGYKTDKIVKQFKTPRKASAASFLEIRSTRFTLEFERDYEDIAYQTVEILNTDNFEIHAYNTSSVLAVTNLTAETLYEVFTKTVFIDGSSSDENSLAVETSKVLKLEDFVLSGSISSSCLVFQTLDGVFNVLIDEGIVQESGTRLTNYENSFEYCGLKADTGFSIFNMKVCSLSSRILNF